MAFTLDVSRDRPRAKMRRMCANCAKWQPETRALAPSAPCGQLRARKGKIMQLTSAHDDYCNSHEDLQIGEGRRWSP